jgi:hypothetical protein
MPDTNNTGKKPSPSPYKKPAPKPNKKPVVYLSGAAAAAVVILVAVLLLRSGAPALQPGSATVQPTVQAAASAAYTNAPNPEIRRFVAAMSSAFARYPNFNNLSPAEMRRACEAVRAPWAAGGPATTHAPPVSKYATAASSPSNQ